MAVSFMRRMFKRAVRIAVMIFVAYGIIYRFPCEQLSSD